LPPLNDWKPRRGFLKNGIFDSAGEQMARRTRSLAIRRAGAAMVATALLACGNARAQPSGGGPPVPSNTADSSPQPAVACRQDGGFEQWLEGVRQEALAKGVRSQTIASALKGVEPDPKIIARDQAQGVFLQSFLQFSDRMVNDFRLVQGRQQIEKHRALLTRIERDFGVPAPVLVALWGLESDFGATKGKVSTLRALVTLAYDCRRWKEFRMQLVDALRLIERGDLKPSQMVGDWGGEMGPMQFPASDYFDFAVDYDGDGKRNLIESVPDMLGSTANYFAKQGWHRGEPWLQEVRVPADLRWEEADLAISHPRSQWANWGVRAADNKALPADDLPASLLLPMGHSGPAFLAYQNFRTFLRWNQALVYATTVAYLAARLDGAPPVARGNAPPPPLQREQNVELQKLLIEHNYLKGEADGRLGRASRAGVKAAQLALGLPADSYPTLALLDRLRARP
jgi:lytic murein transglycosylase